MNNAIVKSGWEHKIDTIEWNQIETLKNETKSVLEGFKIIKYIRDPTRNLKSIFNDDNITISAWNYFGDAITATHTSTNLSGVECMVFKDLKSPATEPVLMGLTWDGYGLHKLAQLLEYQLLINCLPGYLIKRWDVATQSHVYNWHFDYVLLYCADRPAAAAAVGDVGQSGKHSNRMTLGRRNDLNEDMTHPHEPRGCKFTSRMFKTTAMMKSMALIIKNNMLTTTDKQQMLTATGIAPKYIEKGSIWKYLPLQTIGQSDFFHLFFGGILPQLTLYVYKYLHQNCEIRKNIICTIYRQASTRSANISLFSLETLDTGRAASKFRHDYKITHFLLEIVSCCLLQEQEMRRVMNHNCADIDNACNAEQQQIHQQMKMKLRNIRDFTILATIILRKLQIIGSMCLSPFFDSQMRITIKREFVAMVKLLKKLNCTLNERTQAIANKKQKKRKETISAALEQVNQKKLRKDKCKMYKKKQQMATTAERKEQQQAKANEILPKHQPSTHEDKVAKVGRKVVTKRVTT